jgi:putative phosphoesterase
MPAIPMVRVALPTERSLWFGIVADTHGRPHPRASELLARTPDGTAFDAILHGGDVGDLAVLDALAACAPVHAVCGNIDGARSALPDTLLVSIEEGDSPVLRLLLTHIAVSGHRVRPEVAACAQSHDAAIVVCGHSHVPFLGRDRGLTLFNPGSIGPRRMRLPITLGWMRIAHEGVQFLHVNVETGEPWRPQPERASPRVKRR